MNKYGKIKRKRKKKSGKKRVDSVTTTEAKRESEERIRPQTKDRGEEEINFRVLKEQGNMYMLTCAP